MINKVKTKEIEISDTKWLDMDILDYGIKSYVEGFRLLPGLFFRKPNYHVCSTNCN